MRSKITPNRAHTPALLAEVLSCMDIKPGGVYIDATFGAGGYSSAILEYAECQLYGIDRDKSVEKYAVELKKKFGDKFNFIYGAFGELENLSKKNNIPLIDGIVFDIGVSSMQLDEESRGFSFMRDSTLDMRMDREQQLDAKYIVANYSEEQLSDIIFHYGGERKSRKIAKFIVSARKREPIESTQQLASLVKQAVGKYNDSIHPATRTFQALRIEVNDELGQLEKGLEAAHKILNNRGVLAVVTFHSAEDVIVKRYFKQLCGETIKKNKYSKESQFRNSNGFEYVNKKIITPSDEEIIRNPRSRSAKLRAIRRIYESI